MMDEAYVEEAEETEEGSVVDRPDNSTTPTEKDITMLERVCEAVRQAGKELSEEERLHITNSTVSFSSNCRMHTSGKKPKSWKLNYPALAFLVNGGYFADYAGIMGTLGLPTMHHSTWDKLVSCLGTHVERLAEWSCEQVRADIDKRGDRNQWAASFDGFTRGHHSNNSSATVHDMESDRIAWFTHRTKCGKDSNWL